MSSSPLKDSPLKILSLVEATSINAVAKNVLEFYRSAQALNLANSDVPKLDSVIVTFSREPDGNQNEFVLAAQRLNLHVEIISERGRFDTGVLASLRRVVERHRPDVLVTHSVKSHFLLWRSGLLRQFPWIAFHHGYTATDFKMHIYNQLDKWSLPQADRLVTVCQAFAKELAQKTGVPLQEIAVQHNSIRPKALTNEVEAAALRKTLGLTDHERVIVTVGRLSNEKAHRDLLEAFRRLGDRNVNLKLVIVGDGPERARLEAQAAVLDIAKFVIFTGQQSSVHAYYAIADVFVLPSHSEGSPNVLLEAMAARVPIVATSVGGVPEIVQDNETALLVPPKSPEQMADAILRILTDDGLAQKLVENSATVVTTRHAPAHYVEALIQVYQEAINKRRAGSQ